MIIKGSMKYDKHGRKRRQTHPKKRKRNFSAKALTTGSNSKKLEEIKSREKKYPSLNSSSHSTEKIESEESTKTRTVAPAYNKGAYQLIPENEIEDIGK